MRSRKKVICGTLALWLLAAVLGACGVQGPAAPTQTAEGRIPAAGTATPVAVETPAAEPIPTVPEESEEPEETEHPEEAAAPLSAVIPVGEGSGFTAFDSSLIAFLEDAGYGRENLVVSPLSFRAALALAAAGAAGETRDALLQVMGFSSMEEAAEWYQLLLQGVEAFQGQLDREQSWYALYPEDYGGTEPDRAYRIVNSIWHNADHPGEFRPEYRLTVAEQFGAMAENLPAAELTEAVNAWVNEQTQGMIPEMAGNITDMDAVLVNALYLRTAWQTVFQPEDTLPMDFTTAEGETVQKEFLRQWETVSYYADEDTQLVVLPMKGSIMAAIVLGDTAHISDKLDQAERQEVRICFPKLVIETSLDTGALPAYLEARGAGLVFGEEADFSSMSESHWQIQDVLQKAKIKMDEYGIEAAAATVVGMPASDALEEPIVFTADRPFAFYLYTVYHDAPQLLFFGQYLR